MSNGILVTVTRSAGTDGAIVVFIDTEGFGPTGDPGLRIIVNDDDVFTGVPYAGTGDDSDDMEASAVQHRITLTDIPYDRA